VAVRAEPAKILLPTVSMIPVLVVEVQSQRLPAVRSRVPAQSACIWYEPELQDSLPEPGPYPSPVLSEGLIVRYGNASMPLSEWRDHVVVVEVRCVQVHPGDVLFDRFIVPAHRTKPEFPDSFAEAVGLSYGFRELLLGP